MSSRRSDGPVAVSASASGENSFLAHVSYFYHTHPPPPQGVRVRKVVTNGHYIYSVTDLFKNSSEVIERLPLGRHWEFRDRFGATLDTKKTFEEAGLLPDEPDHPGRVLIFAVHVSD
ncbi:hypothetical protein TWF718_003383 [Orbilia javanica]|uniref:Uncharacterized protein n=1 Tax=Orbilia javanica TaxID=47235 RepID=A0AAN8MNH1_9PEZI